jgi:hypothetical protein
MILFLLFFHSSCRPVPQNQNISSQEFGFEYEDATKLSDFSYSRSDVVLTNVDSTYIYFLYLSENINGETAYLLRLQGDDPSKSMRFTVDMSGMHNKISQNRKQIAVNDSNIYMLGFGELHKFKRKGNNYRFDTSYSFKSQGLDRLTWMNDSVLFLGCYYNFHYKEQLDRLSLSVFNTKNDSLTSLISVNDPIGIELTHFVNEFMTFNRNRIAIAFPVENIIKIYNVDTKLKISEEMIISLGIDNNGIKRIFPEDTTMLDRKRMPTKQNIANIDSLLRSYNVSRIQKVFFTDYNHLLVSYVNNQSPDMRTLEYIDISHMEGRHGLVTNGLLKFSTIDSQRYEDALKIQYSSPLFFQNGYVFISTMVKPQKLSKTKNMDNYHLLKYRFQN